MARGLRPLVKGGDCQIGEFAGDRRAGFVY